MRKTAFFPVLFFLLICSVVTLAQDDNAYKLPPKDVADAGEICKECA